MKAILTAAALLATALALPAHAAPTPKPCEELKAEIAKKLDGHGVKGYSLAIVAADKVGSAKVLGSCERGSKRVTMDKK